MGMVGHLAVLTGCLAWVLLSPASLVALSLAVCLVVAGWLYPAALRKLFQARWLVIFGLLVCVNAVWGGERDAILAGVPISRQGLSMGLSMAARALVMLVVVDGFASQVQITELAGLLERMGMPGLGFSLGVAFNLLPSLQQSATNSWLSLRMRGGLRYQAWRGVQLFAITTLANALRRAEEIALAAETRAFTPLNPPILPVRSGRLDVLAWLVVAAEVALLLAMK